MKSIQELATRLLELKEQKRGLEENLSGIQAEISSIEADQLPKIMEDQEVRKITLEGIGTVYLETRVHAAVLAADKQDFYNWLKANGHGSLVKETVHNKTMSSWAKEMLEKNLPLPDMCKAFKQPVARIRSK